MFPSSHNHLVSIIFVAEIKSMVKFDFQPNINKIQMINLSGLKDQCSLRFEIRRPKIGDSQAGHGIPMGMSIGERAFIHSLERLRSNNVTALCNMCGVKDCTA